MLAKRHLLVLVFAGGCLSGATIIGLWREEVVIKQRDTPDARKAERYREPPPAAPFDEDDTEAAGEPHASNDAPAPPKRPDAEAESPTESGSSVADILHGLELAYRQNLAGAPAPPATPPPQSPPRDAPAPAPEETVVAAVAPAPKKHAPSPAAALARAPETIAEEAPQRVASREEPRPDVQIGEIHQNTNVGMVNEGDVYVIEHYVPYFPYYAFPYRNGYVPPAYAPPMSRKPGVPSQGPFTYSDSVFKYPVELVH